MPRFPQGEGAGQALVTEVLVTVDVVTTGIPAPGIPVVLVTVTVGEEMTVLVDVIVGVGRLMQLHALVTSGVGYWVTQSGIGRIWYPSSGAKCRLNGVALAVQELIVFVL